MTQEQLEALRVLCEIVAPSGRESFMTAAMRERFAAYTDHATTDWLGNVTAEFGEGEPSLLFFAHMDEIGFVVRSVTTEGFLRVERLGGVSRRAALGTPVVVLGRDGPVPGVMGLPSHHLTPPEEQFTVPPVESWYVDMGASSEKIAEEMGVGVGSFGTFAPNFRRLGSDYVSSKSLDNRASCWVLVELARRLSSEPPPRRVYLLASVQEEFHLRGLIPAVRRCRPGIAIGLDITPAADTPDLQGRNAVRLGGGPAIKVMDFHGRGSLNGLIVPEYLVEWMEKTASEIGIPTQREVVVGAVTEGTYLPALDIPTAAMAIPARYTHSPCEVTALSDILQTADLCEALSRKGIP